MVKSVRIPSLATEASVYASSYNELPQCIMGCPTMPIIYYWKLLLIGDDGGCEIPATMSGKHAVGKRSFF